APWTVHKTDPEAAAAMVRLGLNLIRLYAVLSEPFIPDASAKMLAALKTVQAGSHRLLRQRILNRPVISSWRDLLDYCRASMGFEKLEQFRVLFLDRKNMIIADELMQKGTVDQTPVYPCEVIRRALELHASALIMVHNHPSGDPTPSRADIEMTKEVQSAGKALGIALHDHVVIGRDDHASFKSLGLL
ncbi:MAG: RadC family protein, partial [Oceanibaculum sp.]